MADIVELAKRVFNERPNTKMSTSAYLLNMAIRLKPMKHLLKESGSVYLHCDSTASHYLKMLMDAIFHSKNFKNEIVWSYQRWTGATTHFQRMHDVILFYGSSKATFNMQAEAYSSKSKHKGRRHTNFKNGEMFQTYTDDSTRMKAMRDVWDISYLNSQAKERLGYPTQKPLELMERIIKTSSNEEDVILDPFCGCGTTLHAAEKLNRQWIGCDISDFAAGLVRNRLMQTERLSRNEITIIGSPRTLQDAMDLANRDKFEFEKWVCGEIGADGMYHNPGSHGADAGVDGIIPFYHAEKFGDKVETAMAIVQVKGGKVTADNVRALSTVVRQHQQHGIPAKCGVFVCFNQYMNTVKNNREKGKVKDWDLKEFDFIQPLSIEDLIQGKRPQLPKKLNKAA